MRFGLTAIFYATAVIAAGIAAFSPCGVLPATVVITFWGFVFSIKHPKPLVHVGVAAGICILIFCGAGLLLPGPRVHGASEHGQCPNNLRQIALAINNYENAQRCYPPAYLADETGRPMHSWRVLILPFLCEKRLYEQYDFSEPWDGPNNRLLIAAMPECFQCPTRRNKRPKGVTSYLAVTGPNTMWPGGKSRNLREITAGTDSTLLVVEAAGTGFYWTEPRDLNVSEFLQCRSSDVIAFKNCPHTTDNFFWYQVHSNAVFADNHTARLWDSAPQDRLDALVTVDGGKKVNLDEEVEKLPESSRHYRPARIVALTVFLLLAILPVIWLPGRVGLGFASRRYGWCGR